MTTEQITKLLIEQLKGEINTLQKEALSASKAGETAKCAELLSQQEVAIQSAISLVEKYNRKKEAGTLF